MMENSGFYVTIAEDGSTVNVQIMTQFWILISSA